MLMELISHLLPDATAVQLDSVEGDASSIVLTLTMVSATVDCPQCQQPATKVHSRYVRTLADLPWATRAVQVRLTVRTFFGHNPACARRIFAEQPPNLVVPFARRTNRLRLEQQQLALAHGGEAGARTARRLKMPLSPDTLLRLARRALLPPLAAPQIIGVDEWSYRRGRSYGTIGVDLERQRAIDLLPDRSAESFANWLKEHPGIRVISRDRAGTYADGARHGAPQATQVADRFHLLQNLRETLERLLTRHQQALHAVTRPTPVDTPAVVAAAGLAERAVNDPPPPLLTRAEERRQQRQEQRSARYQQVIALRNAGNGIRAIALQIGCSRYLVRRYLAAGHLPASAQRRKRPSQIDPFVPYLTAQRAAGHDNAAALYRAIQAQGFGGSASRLRQWVSQHREPQAAPPARPRRGPRPKAPARQQRPLSARGGSWLLVRERQKQSVDAQAQLDRLLAAHPDIAAGYRLAQSFSAMVRERRGVEFDAWLDQAEASALIDFQRFATSLRQDYAAVRAGLTLVWNSGQVEGQVNKLKLIKRMGYGRAKFDLLKQRVLAP